MNCKLKTSTILGDMNLDLLLVEHGLLMAQQISVTCILLMPVVINLKNKKNLQRGYLVIIALSVGLQRITAHAL